MSQTRSSHRLPLCERELNDLVQIFVKVYFLINIDYKKFNSDA